MKIAHVIRTLDPAAGGPPMVATRLAAAQAAAGNDVHLFSYAAPETSRDAVAQSLRRVPHFSRVTRHDLPVKSAMERVGARQAKRTLLSAMGDFDVAHLHGVWDPILKAAATAARKTRVPYVVAAHGMLDPWSMRQKAMKKKIALLLGGYRRMLNGCAFLHALNADEQRLISPLGLSSPVEVIPNGIFLEEIDPLPTSGTFYLSRTELANAPYVLFLSRIHFKKGLDYLAEAMRIVANQSADARLVVAGPDDGARADLERDIARLNLQSRVHIVGPLYGAEKFAAMVDAACFCLPSRQEGFSVAVTEAMACGRPVVISDACHFPEVASSGAGYVVPLEPVEIANKLLHLFEDESLRRTMGEKGRELVRSNYTWPKIAEQSIRAYVKHGARGSLTPPPATT